MRRDLRDASMQFLALRCLPSRIMPPMKVDLELFQFRYSHYNEKVRWALDFKGLAHRRTDLLPGLHAATVNKLTGQNQTPVLRMNDEYVHDSAWIIERLELVFKDAPSLLPTDAAMRDRALELARHFDHVVGPATRACAFVAMLDDVDYIARTVFDRQACVDAHVVSGCTAVRERRNQKDQRHHRTRRDRRRGTSSSMKRWSRSRS